ncbi:IS66 family insertion sequence element accessory protein TnpB, partial [Photorhabdus viridis]
MIWRSDQETGLHRAHFVWPKQGERSWVMTPAQFDWLIRGIHWQQVE